MDQDNRMMGKSDFTGPSPVRQGEVTRRDPPSHTTALMAAAGSLVASALAIWTGNAWLAALAILLTGIATLLPGFFDYQRTRHALEEARHWAGMAMTLETHEKEQIIEWPDPSGHTIH